jgi:anti-anti-sigma regulatory factor
LRFDGAQMAVEIFSPQLLAVRMAGVLDRVTAARLAALVRTQLDRPGCTGHIVVDLGEVGFFGTDDLSDLLAVRESARTRGVELHIAGISAREGMVPLPIMAAFARFSSFPTLEAAESALAGAPVPVGG